MSAPTEKSNSLIAQSPWYRTLAKYEKPSLPKASWQLINTLVPYVSLWAAMIWMIRHGISYWLVLPLVVLAGAFLIRVFIFFHDCGHGSFFASRSANRFWGYLCGTLTFTPFEDWRHQHAGHHGTTADLDRRGTGDIWTMTVKEYIAAPLKTKIAYRLSRNPIVLFILGPPVVFLITQRFPRKGDGKRERNSVALTNLALLGILSLAIWTIGWKTYLLIQLPMICLVGGIGVWLFYVQHQYEESYWARHDNWDPMLAALEGSSYYKLPKILQWFTGNIGLHHIHHLRPRIPNYNLQRAYDEIPALQAVEPLTISRSIKSLRLNLWDETNKKMVGFRALKAHKNRPSQ